MTKESLAEMLSGRDYRHEISQVEQQQAKADGLVVIFGASDDLMELRGAIYGEVDCWGGFIVHVHQGGVLPFHSDRCDCPFCGYQAAVERCASVWALWGAEKDYSWTYQTNVPHVSFVIYEDGEPYCRGIVIDIKDLPIL